MKKVSLILMGRKRQMSVAESLSVMFSFGMFIISLIKLILTLQHNHDKKIVTTLSQA